MQLEKDLRRDELSDGAFRRDLGDGLLLRWSTAEDAERLAEFYSWMFRDTAQSPQNTRIIAWVRDMMSGRHPLIGATDFALVEDTRADKIVAATCLLSQAWRFADQRIPVGRPEIVATDPDYRRRGLIRAIFALIHARSDSRGDLAQEITGIYYYYRQFGYEYALDLGGSHDLALGDIPRLKDGDVERFTLRPATLADIPTLMRYEVAETAPYLLSTAIGEEYWRWLLDAEQGVNPEDVEVWRTYLIEESPDATENGSGTRRTVGHIFMARERWDKGIPIFGCYTEPGVSLVAAVPSLLREIARVATDLPARAEAPVQPTWISFMLGGTHPVYAALGKLGDKVDPPYATYVRVADLPAFLRHIAPVLERRLAESPMSGHSGETRLDFFHGGLRLVFEHGKLMTAEDWQIPVWGTAQGCFPPLVFLQLLFGYRSLAELRYAFPDVRANDETTALLNILFPKLPSSVGPLG